MYTLDHPAIFGYLQFHCMIEKNVQKNVSPHLTLFLHDNNVQTVFWFFFAFLLDVFDSNLCAPASSPPRQINPVLNMDSSPYPSAASPSPFSHLLSAPTAKATIAVAAQLPCAIPVATKTPPVTIMGGAQTTINNCCRCALLWVGGRQLYPACPVIFYQQPLLLTSTTEAARLAALEVANLLGHTTRPPIGAVWGGWCDIVAILCCGDDGGMQLVAKEKDEFFFRREGWPIETVKKSWSHKDQRITQVADGAVF
jgi:hypothetical protein